VKEVTKDSVKDDLMGLPVEPTGREIDLSFIMFYSLLRIRFYLDKDPDP